VTLWQRGLGFQRARNTGESSEFLKGIGFREQVVHRYKGGDMAGPAILPLLTVTVVGFGGPPSVSVGHPEGIPLANGAIVVSSHGRQIARTRHGHLSLRVRPGAYRIAASLNGRPCSSRTTTITRSERSTSVVMGCSIK
jgi:hypothetical protein